MFRREIRRSFLWLVSLCTVLSIGIIGCGRDDDNSDWIGTWAVETVDGQAYEQAFEEERGEKASIVTNNWTFNGDGTIEAGVAVRISGEVSSVKMMGTYSLSSSNYTITTTVTEGTGFFLEGATDDTEVDTGTWSRTGRTLTLNSDDGSIIVLKKK